MTNTSALISIKEWQDKCKELRKANEKIAELKQDAKRYRWLRDVGGEHWTSLIKRSGKCAAQIDAIIDAAMEKNT